MPKKSSKDKKTLDLTQHEKAVREKEMDEKFAQIQEELRKSEQQETEESYDEPEEEEVYEEEEEEPEPVRKPLPKPKAVKQIAPPVKKYTYIPRKPVSTPAPRKRLDTVVQQTSLELLKQDFHKQMRNRLMQELFDY
jgi:hypothetical protein